MGSAGTARLCVSVCLSVPLCVSVCMSVSLCVSVSVWVCDCLSVCLCLCLFGYLCGVWTWAFSSISWARAQHLSLRALAVERHALSARTGHLHHSWDLGQFMLLSETWGQAWPPRRRWTLWAVVIILRNNKTVKATGAGLVGCPS